METHIWIIILIVSVIVVGVGVGLGVYFGLKKQKPSVPADTENSIDPAAPENQAEPAKADEAKPIPGRKPWTDLMSSQVVKDQFKISDILSWINGIKDTLTENDKIFLFKSTKENVEKAGFLYSDKIDPNTNVIACVINAEKNTISHTLLFSFGSASEKVNDLFADYDYAEIEI